MIKRNIICSILFIVCANTLFAQTEIDGMMMQKKFLCIGATASTSSWKNYWETKFYRNNLNLGTVSTKSASLMGNYGITDRWNIIFGLPYVKTNASAGQLAGQNGFQDVSLFSKYALKPKSIFKGKLTPIFIAGFNMPMSNYTADLLPLSIGFKSKVASFRAMADYEKGNFITTISAAYMYRGNVILDRNTYYTTEIIYSNKVQLPNTTNVNLRIGYRGINFIGEAILDQSNTLGGFDISKNNMPFISNKMNATKIGSHLKWEVYKVDGLSLVADVFTTISGRNVGDANFVGGGFFYIINFKPKKNEIK